MRYSLILGLVVLMLTECASAQPLLRIKVHGKIGFIDTTGKVVIEPRFVNAGEFREEVAVAREPRGLYGYIDKSGRFVIPPQFEYALPFSEGLAVAYQHGRGRFIQRDGSDAFVFTFKRASPFIDGLSRVEFETDKWNLIDEKGKRLVDSNVDYIDEFHEGYAVLGRDDLHSDFQRRMVIDRDGHVKFVLDSIMTLDPCYEGFFFCRYIRLSRDSNGRLHEELVAANVDPAGHRFPVSEAEDIAHRSPYPSIHDPYRFFEASRAADERVVMRAGDERYSRNNGSEGYDITYLKNPDYRPITIEGQRVDPASQIIGTQSFGSSFAVKPTVDSSLTGVLILVDDHDTIRTSEPRSNGAREDSLIGLRVTLENRSRDTIELTAPSSDEFFIMQAKDEEGKWRDIEQAYWGDVSDGIHLPPGRMYMTYCPIMHGSFSTTLRLKIDLYREPSDAWTGVPPFKSIYSNEINSSVNPAQFWRVKYDELLDGHDD